MMAKSEGDKDFGRLIEKLKKNILNYDEKAARVTAEEINNEGFDPSRAIDEGVSKGLEEVGRKFGIMEIYLPELILAADIAKIAISILKEKFPSNKESSKGKIVLGTVHGDIHDIGKNIVKASLIGAGCRI